MVGDYNGWDSTASLFTQRGQTRHAAVTVHAGRRYGYRSVAAEDWERSSNRQDDGYKAHGRAVGNSVLDRSGVQGVQMAQDIAGRERGRS